ncbi:MAG: oligosaccharide flippase family protein [Lawsonibacter sp.]
MGQCIQSAGRGALFLTALGAISHALAFAYRVALSRLVGAEVMGLYQLIMPVYSVLLSFTAVGLTAAVSNLTSQYLALGNRRGAHQTLTTCLWIFFLLLLPLGGVVTFFSDPISVFFLGDARTQLGLILLVPCVALTGVENFHKHVFYGAGLIHPPAVVELLEQILRTGAVLGLLLLFLPQYPERVVGLIVSGMVLCEIFSAVTLVFLYRRRLGRYRFTGPGEQRTIRRHRIASIALPVGANALLGNFLGAANATLIPQKLVEGGMDRSAAMAQFGIVCGMTLPMLALPTVFLGALNLILVPRLARAVALRNAAEVRRLTRRAVDVVSVIVLPAMALMVVLGPDLSRFLFQQEQAGTYLLPLAVAMALSSFCSLLGGVLNGIGCQRQVAAVSLLGGIILLGFTFALVPLPGIGMDGYVAGVLVSTLVETVLCFWFAKRHTGLHLEFFSWMVAPGLASLLSALNTNLLLQHLKRSGISLVLAWLICFCFAILLYLAALSAQGVHVRAIFALSPSKRAKK